MLTEIPTLLAAQILPPPVTVVTVITFAPTNLAPRRALRATLTKAVGVPLLEVTRAWPALLRGHLLFACRLEAALWATSPLVPDTEPVAITWSLMRPALTFAKLATPTIMAAAAKFTRARQAFLPRETLAGEALS